ncbi:MULTISPECIES: hypothetical protein [Sphingomonas]|uniref:hypothetical protein n=1 Tax=Sphingomonas TaxID=13687 RepID=UPI000830F146|nr:MULTISPECIES: hypothetical protein [Sphingomonas]MBY0301287.1 hypothetical protein [Sphingomonas ginsenosidimutans]
MTAFVWTDRDGQRHELDTPAHIEAEAADIARELDRHVNILDGADRPLRDTARTAIRKLQPRLEQLQADLARWNDHAIAVTRTQAATLVEQIDRLPTIIADVLLVVELQVENARLLTSVGDAPDVLARTLSEPITALQIRAISACTSRPAPPGPATRGEAKEWLDTQPSFARNEQIDGGWFAWIDRKGHAHRLIDPLMIEREVVAVARELRELRPALIAGTPPNALYTAMDAGSASWARLIILRGDLERYVFEATAREDAAWAKYAADWRTKRKRS